MTDFTLLAADDTQILGVIDPYERAEIVARYNEVSTFEIELPAETAAARMLLDAARPRVVIRAGPTVFRSGPVIRMERTADLADDTLVVSGVDDTVWLRRRVAHPQPSKASPPYDGTAYDTRTGAASTVIAGVIDANAGPGAIAARRVPGLVVPTPAALGPTGTWTFRYENLFDVVKSIAEGAGLGFVVRDLVLDVYAPGSRPSPNLWTANQADVETDLAGILASDYPATVLTSPNVVFNVNQAGGGETAVSSPDFTTAGGAPAPTLSRDATQFWQGAASCKVVLNAANPVNSGMRFGGGAGAANNRTPVTGGQVYTASVYVRGNAGGENLALVVAYYDAASAFISQTANQPFTIAAAGVWQRATATGTVPANCASIGFQVIGTAAATGYTYWVDGFQVEAGSAATAWSLPGSSLTPAAAVSRVTTEHWHGAASVRAVQGYRLGTGAGASGSKVAVLPSRSYTASAYLRGAAGGEVVSGLLHFYDAGNALVYSSGPTLFPALTTGWARVHISATAPPTAAWAAWEVFTANGLPQTFYADGAQIEQAAAASAWSAPGSTITVPGAVFAADFGTLAGWSSAVEAPAANHVYVAGGGEGTARVIREASDSASELDWGRIETFQDRRDTTDTAELDQAGAETLAESVTPAAVELQALDTASQAFLTDWGLGTVGTARVGEVSITDVIREVRIVLEGNRPPVITPVLGGVSVDLALFRRLGAAERRIRQLERV